MTALHLLYKWQYVSRQWIAAQHYKIFSVEDRKPTSVPKRVLIVISGLLGDSVMSTPVLAAARHLWPDAQIIVLGQKQNLELLRACPYVDGFYEAQAIPFSFRKRHLLRPLTEWVKLKRFDLAMILLGDQFAALLANAEIPVRVGVKGHLLESFLTHCYDIKSPREWGPPERMNALRCLEYEIPDSLPQLWVQKEACFTAQEKLKEGGLPSGSPYIVIHTFGSTRRQWWPLHRANHLAATIAQRYGLKTILVGGSETVETVSTAELSDVINTTGNLKLQELLAVIQGAALVISTDSGPYHMAGALKRPLIGLFRACRPEHASRYPQAKVIFGIADECQRRCKWDHCQFNPCKQLSNIDEAEVSGVAGDMLCGTTF